VIRTRSTQKKAIFFVNDVAKRIAVLAVALAMIAGQFVIAQYSLRQESPTIDEVLHLPAGITYWDTHSFRLYHHNPPLVKLLAAWPVLNRVTPAEREKLYSLKYWTDELPNKAGFGHEFAKIHATDYFELFTAARSVIPVFLAIGGVFVFLWARSVYGDSGGLLSLALWSICPNLLAHGRLITTDAASAALGTGATFVFMRYVKRPGSLGAIAAGLMLGISLLTKFSLLTLVIFWPIIWAFHFLTIVPANERKKTAVKSAQHAAIVTLVSMLTVNLGYGFEGTGQPLGKFEFYSSSMTRELPANRPRLHATGNDLLDLLGSRRVNRFRDTWLAALPCPLPAEFMLGFDEQKIDAEGVPKRFTARAEPGDDSSVEGYPVYLNGELRGSGWWYYYPYAFLIKTPPGFLALIAASSIILILKKHTAAERFDAFAMLIVPVATVLTMTFLTDINIGLRYVLPAMPYLYVNAGRIVPFVQGIGSTKLRRMSAAITIAVVAGSVWSTASVAPHFLAYFNIFGGGPDHGSEHLIDSNLDWGQDLVNLKDWADKNAPGEPIGIAYFGQINPDIFRLRGAGLDWFLPPSRPETMKPVPPGRASGRVVPGYYAVSASLVHGLPWRVYDPARWEPYSAEQSAFDYFLKAKPITKIGWSIFVYKLDESQAGALETERTREIPK
jgi:hypothetical protein